MRSSSPGKSTSPVEILNISKQGLWIFVQGREYFLPFKEYPWFKDAKVSEVYNVTLTRNRHLHWLDLDVDLEIEALQYPEKFPLIYHAC